MTEQQLSSKYQEVMEEIIPIGDNIKSDRLYYKYLFLKMFNKYPSCYEYMEKDKIVNNDGLIENLNKYFKDEYFSVTDYAITDIKKPLVNIVILENVIIALNGDCSYNNSYAVYSLNEDKNIRKCLVFKDSDSFYGNYWFLVRTNMGFRLREFDKRPPRVDIENNYNTDLDDDFVCKDLSNDEIGLYIFHGKPGTGKSTYLKSLVNRIEKRFIFINVNNLLDVQDNSLVEVLQTCPDSILILEDCEQLIQKSEIRSNALTNLLNLTDGILGEAMALKFICTFNVDIDQIDPALLRKGRLKYKYEFKSLNADKTFALGKLLNKDIPEGISLPLCDIYNYDKTVNVENKKRIGF